jgi:hypothetical protein
MAARAHLTSQIYYIPTGTIAVVLNTWEDFLPQCTPGLMQSPSGIEATAARLMKSDTSLAFKATGTTWPRQLRVKAKNAGSSSGCDQNPVRSTPLTLDGLQIIMRWALRGKLSKSSKSS